MVSQKAAEKSPSYSEKITLVAEAVKGDAATVNTWVADTKANSKELVFAGEGAKELVETAFGEPEENWVHVPGLVSRKKQFVPSVLHVLQQ